MSDAENDMRVPSAETLKNVLTEGLSEYEKLSNVTPQHIEDLVNVMLEHSFEQDDDQLDTDLEKTIDNIVDELYELTQEND